MKTKDLLIFVPTYNERENVELIYRKLRETCPDAGLLFLDDNSPDGTGGLLDGLAAKDPGLRVIHRPAKRGIGSAHLEGIRRAVAEGWARLLTMDCDFTHQPEDIPAFLKESEADVVVGSRYMDAGSLADWNLFRKTLTMAGHFMTTRFLNMPQDATGAFRLYRLDRIPAGLFELVRSAGYSFFFESLFILRMNGFTIREIPIRLPARTYGHSKMSWLDAARSLSRLISTALAFRLRRKRFIYARPAEQPAAPGAAAEWDAYWAATPLSRHASHGEGQPCRGQAATPLSRHLPVRQAGASHGEGRPCRGRAAEDRGGKALYDGIAQVYRKFLIKGTLERFVRKNFAAGAALLHAGCGSGQVDTGVVRFARVTAVDISDEALRRYRAENGRNARAVRGSVFALPFGDGEFDGVYNLGVMEHFTEEEIARALGEFRRVLKPGGKILLFWPPEFGLSVQALKFLHFLLNRVLRKGVKLHPDEITRVRSRSHVRGLLERSAFVLESFYFGPSDFFTHAIVVGRKQAAPVSAERMPRG